MLPFSILIFFFVGLLFGFCFFGVDFFTFCNAITGVQFSGDRTVRAADHCFISVESFDDLDVSIILNPGLDIDGPDSVIRHDKDDFTKVLCFVSGLLFFFVALVVISHGYGLNGDG